MYMQSPKKMIVINILNILKKYSDAEHRLTQQDIIKYLKDDYGMVVNRQTVKRNLMNLLEFGVEYTEVDRKDKKGRENSLCTDWYIEREFDDSELRLLIDSLLFSKTVPEHQCKALIKKLKGLSNVYFEKKVAHICNLPENQIENPQLFYNIDVIDEAITKNKKISFMYNGYGADKKLHPKRDFEYVVNPYQMVATNGRYYLICNYDWYDTLSNYRIDRITNIKITDEKRKPIGDLKEGGLNLPKHMAEHIYMYAGESIRAKFNAANYIIDQVVDWFGADVRITPISDSECAVEVNVNEEAFFYWALQYGLHIEVIQPESLRNRLCEAVGRLNEKYNG